MEVEIAKWIANLGPGGVLAACMFYIYLRCDKRSNEREESLRKTVEANTEALIRLSSKLERNF